ncbi:hypothetical protein LM599_03610 [Candidatus Acetothermia bacterium]|jgi:hypothetical protein|nr:hypothetical protein [Candidatus Acetothermia bacterium]MCI2426997.1 hypothetical protein [Candidatus Acetothermia bacterium]MCI2428439.1 hypothetical protein [Candidatus Acetothermia bacterium]
MKYVLLLSLALVIAISGYSFAQVEEIRTGRELLERVLEFIYTAAHWIGRGIVNLVEMILPRVIVPEELVDPIGFLALLTIFLTVAAVARKVVWFIVAAGWILIAIRLIIVIVETYW